MIISTFRLKYNLYNDNKRFSNNFTYFKITEIPRCRFAFDVYCSGAEISAIRHFHPSSPRKGRLHLRIKQAAVKTGKMIITIIPRLFSDL